MLKARRTAPAAAVLAAMALFFAACDEPARVAGGASETEATVAGRVERPDGTPVGGVAVRLRPTWFLSDTGLPALPKASLRTKGDVMTASDGSFRFDSVFLGSYAVEARDSAAAGAYLVATVDGSLGRADAGRMVLRPAAVLTGRVALPPGAKGGAFVRVFGLDRAVRTDSAGAFSLAGLPGGIFDVKVTPASPSAAPRAIYGITVQPGVRTDLGEVALAPSLDGEDYSTWGDSARLRVDTRAAGIADGVSGFPLLVRLDRSNFDFAAATGLDLRFADDRGRPLAYEIERWDPLAGRAEIWVRADTLRGGDSAQYLTLHWNRPGASGRSDGSAVFDTALGYQGAWHLSRPSDETGAAFRDASGQGNDAFGEGLDSSGAAQGIAYLGQTLNGTSQSLYTSKAFPGPDTFTVSLWFRTASTTGGKLIGFGSYQTGSSYFNDRHVWMDDQGRIRFGVYPETPAGSGKGTTHVVSTTQAYNDGAWHYVAARLSAAGLDLFLDGAQVASDPSVHAAFPYSGFWRIGYDGFGNWTDLPRNAHFRGTLDEVRVTRSAWSDAAIKLAYENQKPGSTLVMVRP